MTALMLRKSGNSVTVAIPADTRARLGLEVGDQLTLIEEPDGIRLVKYDPELERQLEAARAILKEEYEVLRALAR